jgi:hypothetical protein
MTGLSRAPLTRLVGRCLATGRVRIKTSHRHRFPTRYPRADLPRYAAWDEVFLACIYRNPLSLDEQRVATLHDQRVFVIVMHLLGGNGILGARPRRNSSKVFSPPAERDTIKAVWT